MNKNITEIRLEQHAPPRTSCKSNKYTKLDEWNTLSFILFPQTDTGSLKSDQVKY